MSPARLAQYGFLQFDTRNASDHLPKVTDYSINVSTDVADINYPVDFSLEQNYPNPFNPTTKIGFTIPLQQNPLLGGDYRGGIVTLKVYGVLGKEVATLVNKELPAGTYEVEFDGSELTSGVYFYKLQAAEFIEIKKMTFLK
jgi:hypothetical protein